jgi:hypothetical protein
LKICERRQKKLKLASWKRANVKKNVFDVVENDWDDTKNEKRLRKTLRRINMLWKLNEKKFARNQFVQLLRNMRRCVLRNLSLNDARRVVNVTIKNRLMNFAKKMSTSKKLINKNWIKMTNKNYDSFRIEFALCSNSSLTTLSSSLSFVMRFTLSSSFVTRLREKKKLKNDFRCFLFFNYVVIDWKKKSKNNFCWFFLSSNIIIIVANVVIYCFWVFVCLAIDSSWSSSTLKNIIMMFKTFLKNEDCFIIYFDENLLAELIHNVSSSFMLSFDLISFVMFVFASLFLVFIVLASSVRVFRFRKRAHESSSTLS